MTQSKFAPSDIVGILPPMTTPFNDSEEIDLGSLRRQASFLMDEGAHGIVVGGSAGEGFALTTEELRQITSETLRDVVRWCAGSLRRPVKDR